MLIQSLTRHFLLLISREHAPYYEGKLGFSPKGEIVESHVLYEAGEGTSFTVYQRADPPKAENTAMSFGVSDVSATVTAGFPIGSGLVEGSCKLVVGKRFKGNGMRWKLDDNKAVLKTRLAELNDELEAVFTKKSRKYSFVEPENSLCQPELAHA